LTTKLEIFRAEDEAVLKAGLSGADITVDDTAHRGPDAHQTAPPPQTRRSSRSTI
jgi:hypothetical protein